MNFKILVIILFTIGFLINMFFNLLRIRQSKKDLPEEVHKIYNLNNYDKTIKYLNRRRMLSLIKETILYIYTMILLSSNIISSYFYYLTSKLGNYVYITNTILLMTFAVFYLTVDIIFDYIYLKTTDKDIRSTKITNKRFFIDKLIISASRLATIFVAVYVAYDGASVAVDDDMSWLSTVLILVLFGIMYLIRRYFVKLKPLPDGELKDKIENYCKEQNFKFKRVYMTNSSKRTSRVNAYFQGFGPFRKIVLYDTLINNFSDEEVLAVFAHEVGHAKNKDTIKIMLVLTPLMLIVMALFYLMYDLTTFYSSFNFNESNVSITLFVFYSLKNIGKTIFNLIFNPIIRKLEYKADKHEALTLNKEISIRVLHKISVNNFNDLNPHPIDIFVNHSHPTIIQRIEAIKKL